ncbi:MAG: hypothetical protein H7A25_26150 [Leptospiraceae bacterium]|nr:hypothetical protein [Leptospiraceae bacterium]MCP5503409.1 hypothetical protein [Leptospiraceae bacterium]
MIKKTYLFLLLSFLFSLTYCDNKKETDKKPVNPPATKTGSSTSSGPETEKVTPFYVKVNDSLIMRSEPSTSSDKVSCNQFSMDSSLHNKNGWTCASSCSRDTTALSPGDILEVHEQTKEEVKVNKWSARWYKVSVISDYDKFYYSYSCPDYFWVYGKFVDKTNYTPPKDK